GHPPVCDVQIWRGIALRWSRIRFVVEHSQFPSRCFPDLFSLCSHARRMVWSNRRGVIRGSHLDDPGGLLLHSSVSSFRCGTRPTALLAHISCERCRYELAGVCETVCGRKAKGPP